MSYIYTWNKKERKKAICNNTDGEILILSEVSQKEKGKYRMIPLLCGI